MAEDIPGGGTGGLDQNLRLRASLDDEVSPSVDRIEKKVSASSETFRKFSQAASSAGKEAGQAVEGMSDTALSSLNRLEQALKDTQQAWEETRSKTKQSSKDIGSAIEDDLYSDKVTVRLQNLNKDFKELEQTMRGMADTRRAASARSRRASSSARDTVNEKLIPAFEVLHGTLEQYPGTLEKINKIEQDRLTILERGGEVLAQVKNRVGEVKQATGQLRLGIEDALSMAMAGTIGKPAMDLQERQRQLTRLGGGEQFDLAPQVLSETGMAAETSMANLAPMIDAIVELQSMGPEAMASIAEETYNVEKATGLAADRVIAMRDSLERIADIKGDDVSHMLDMIKVAADSSAASVEGMMGSLERSSEAMLALGDDARRAFAVSSMAASAQTANMGLGEDYTQNLRSRLIDDPQSYVKFKGFLAQTTGINLDDIIDDPEKLQQAAQLYAKSSGFTAEDMSDYIKRAQYKSVMGDIFSPEEFTRLYKGDEISVTGRGQRVTAEGLEQAEGAIKKQAELIRSGATEELEKIYGKMESTLIGPGKPAEVLARDTSFMLKHVNLLADKGIESFNKLDEVSDGLASLLIARGVEANAAYTAFKGVGGLGKAILGTGTGFGAAGLMGGAFSGATDLVTRFFTGGSNEDKGLLGGGLSFAKDAATTSVASTALDLALNRENTVNRLSEDPGQYAMDKAKRGVGIELGATVLENIGLPKWASKIGGLGLFHLGDKVFGDKEEESIKTEGRPSSSVQSTGNIAEISEELSRPQITVEPLRRPEDSNSPKETPSSYSEELLHARGREDERRMFERGTSERRAVGYATQRASSIVGATSGIGRALPFLGGALSAGSLGLELKDKGIEGLLKESKSIENQRDLLQQTRDEGGISAERVFDKEGQIDYSKLILDQPAFYAHYQNLGEEDKESALQSYQTALKEAYEKSDIKPPGVERNDILDRALFHGGALFRDGGESFQGWEKRGEEERLNAILKKEAEKAGGLSPDEYLLDVSGGKDRDMLKSMSDLRSFKDMVSGAGANIGETLLNMIDGDWEPAQVTQEALDKIREAGLDSPISHSGLAFEAGDRYLDEESGAHKQFFTPVADTITRADARFRDMYGIESPEKKEDKDKSSEKIVETIEKGNSETTQLQQEMVTYLRTIAENSKQKREEIYTPSMNNSTNIFNRAARG